MVYALLGEGERGSMFCFVVVVAIFSPSDSVRMQGCARLHLISGGMWISVVTSHNACSTCLCSARGSTSQNQLNAKGSRHGKQFAVMMSTGTKLSVK